MGKVYVKHFADGCNGGEVTIPGYLILGITTSEMDIVPHGTTSEIKKELIDWVDLVDVDGVRKKYRVFDEGPTTAERKYIYVSYELAQKLFPRCPHCNQVLGDSANKRATQ